MRVYYDRPLWEIYGEAEPTLLSVMKTWIGSPIGSIKDSFGTPTNYTFYMIRLAISSKLSKTRHPRDLDKL